MTVVYGYITAMYRIYHGYVTVFINYITVFISHILIRKPMHIKVLEVSGINVNPIQINGNKLRCIREMKRWYISVYKGN